MSPPPLELDLPLLCFTSNRLLKSTWDIIKFRKGDLKTPFMCTLHLLLTYNHGANSCFFFNNILLQYRVADFSNVAAAIATGPAVALGDSVALPKLANRMDRHMKADKEHLGRGADIVSDETQQQSLVLCSSRPAPWQGGR